MVTYISNSIVTYENARVTDPEDIFKIISENMGVKGDLLILNSNITINSDNVRQTVYREQIPYIITTSTDVFKITNSNICIKSNNVVLIIYCFN